MTKEKLEQAYLLKRRADGMQDDAQIMERQVASLKEGDSAQIDITHLQPSDIAILKTLVANQFEKANLAELEFFKL